MYMDPTLRARIEEILAQGRQADENWGSLTPAQKDQVARFSVRILIGLCLHIMGRPYNEPL